MTHKNAWKTSIISVWEKILYTWRCTFSCETRSLTASTAACTKITFRTKEPTLMSHARGAGFLKKIQAHFNFCVLCARARPAQIAFSAANFLLRIFHNKWLFRADIYLYKSRIGMNLWMRARESAMQHQGHDAAERITDFEVGDGIARDLCRHSNAAARALKLTTHLHKSGPVYLHLHSGFSRARFSRRADAPFFFTCDAFAGKKCAFLPTHKLSPPNMIDRAENLSRLTIFSRVDSHL
jgi:hypothetical protein